MLLCAACHAKSTQPGMRNKGVLRWVTLHLNQWRVLGRRAARGIDTGSGNRIKIEIELGKLPCNYGSFPNQAVYLINATKSMSWLRASSNL